MPIYEYHCNYCDKDLEQLMPFQYADEATCPDCGQPAMRKPSRAFIPKFPIRSVKVKGEDVR